MTAVDYHVVDRAMGTTAQEATDILNSIGASGWQINQNYLINVKNRRSVFVQAAAGTPEYLVIDWPTGDTPAELEQLLDSYGVDGWELQTVDVTGMVQRRAIFMRGVTGTSGGGIAEAPQDGSTYGRMNATWNPAIARNNDIIDGGAF
jgi:hypothetical protein